MDELHDDAGEADEHVRYGREVRYAREHAGMSQKDLAEALHFRPPYVSKIESGAQLGSDTFAEGCDRVFGTPGLFQRLRAQEVKRRHLAWFRPYVDLEHQAVVIRSFEVQVAPGLLQTEEYARAVLSAGRQPNVEELVASRLARQHILERDAPPDLWVVLDENVLHRPVGGRTVMRGQLERLIQVAEVRTNVLQVVPYGAGEHPGFGPFAILTLPDGNQAVYEEGFSQGQVFADSEHVTEALRAYDLLRAVALSPKESVGIITDVLKEL